MSSRKPSLNILYLHSHDTGRYIQPFGVDVPTPNLQKLAEEGVLFRQAFCANPTCSPSRACLLTGQYAHTNGMLGLCHRGFELNNYDHHIIRLLQEHGYFCALSGIQHIDGACNGEGNSYGARIGYDLNMGRHGTDADGNRISEAEQAVTFLKNAPQQPFFLSVGFGETHKRFPEPSEEFDPRYTMPPPVIPDTPETRKEWAGYKTSARTLDTKIGAILQTLEEQSLTGNTLVICTTDHGIPLPNMKCSLTDHGIGVFLILRGPKNFSGGQVIDQMVSQIDLYPTICELLEIPVPERVQGTSILPLLQNPEEPIRTELFAEVNYHAAYEPKRCIRTKRWKYIRNWNAPYPNPVLPNCDDGEAKTLLMEHDWSHQTLPDEELYDLVFDPQERNNLASSEAHTEIRDDLCEQLRTWMEETDDPLLSGSVPAPSGAKVNPQNQLSPKDPPTEF